MLGLAVFDAVLEPRELLLAKHGGLGIAGIGDIVEAAMRAGVEQEKVAVGHAEPAVTTPADGVGLRAVGLGRRIDPQPMRPKHLDNLVHGGVGVARLSIQLGILHAGG